MRRRPPVVLAAVVLALLTGCTGLPRSGPVIETTATVGSNPDRGVFIDPRPPQPGSSPAEVVKGFLDAMTATPIRTDVAREFLSDDFRTAWDPEESTIIYGDAGTPRGTALVSVALTDAERLDARGAWQGAVPAEQEQLDFPMAVENGEYRIAEAPNALVVPQAWFEQRFRQVALYFFDPTAEILVPEPVFVPRGEQLSTALVAGLLRGPGSELRRVARSFIPSGLSAGLSVPVSADGVADVALTGDTGSLNGPTVERVLAQLAWTLRQDPQIEALRLSIDGRPIRLPGEVAEVDVGLGVEYDPSGDRPNPLLFGNRDGVLVSGPAQSLEPVAGPLGAEQYGIGAVAVNLDATRVAATSGGGRGLLLAPVDDQDTQVRQVVSGATSLLKPAWDFADRLWLVDRTPNGALVSYLDTDEDAATARAIQVPGVSGRRVRAFLVSRDGSRLVAVVRRAGRDEIRVSRLRHDDQGRVLGATPSVPISWDDDSGQLRIKDVGWQSPTSLVVLHRLAEQLYEVRAISVDGSPADSDSLSTTVRGQVVALVGSPVPTQRLYARTVSILTDLSSARPAPVALDPGQESLGYVG